MKKRARRPARRQRQRLKRAELLLVCTVDPCAPAGAPTKARTGDEVHFVNFIKHKVSGGQNIMMFVTA